MPFQKVYLPLHRDIKRKYMKTYLVTGAAGFIGANYIKYILAKHDDVTLFLC